MPVWPVNVLRQLPPRRMDHRVHPQAGVSAARASGRSAPGSAVASAHTHPPVSCRQTPHQTLPGYLLETHAGPVPTPKTRSWVPSVKQILNTICLPNGPHQLGIGHGSGSVGVGAMGGNATMPGHGRPWMGISRRLMRDSTSRRVARLVRCNPQMA